MHTEDVESSCPFYCHMIYFVSYFIPPQVVSIQQPLPSEGDTGSAVNLDCSAWRPRSPRQVSHTAELALAPAGGGIHVGARWHRNRRNLYLTWREGRRETSCPPLDTPVSGEGE